MTTASRHRATATKRWYDFVPDPPPVEDGMLQNPIIEDIASVLRLHFKPRADSVLVSGPTFILYDINDPNARIAPDCYVVFDVDAHAIVGHNSYRVWQWGKPPDFALEIASESTALNDLTAKRDIHARIGALEYWRFDPSGGELYGEPLAGERLVDGKYEPYPIHTDTDGDIWAHSEALNLDFYMRGNRFWVKDSATGEWLNFIEAEVEAHEVTKLAHEATSLAHDRERQSHEATRLGWRMAGNVNRTKQLDWRTKPKLRRMNGNAKRTKQLDWRTKPKSRRMNRNAKRTNRLGWRMKPK